MAPNPISQHSHDSMVLGATAVEEAKNNIAGLRAQLEGHHTDLMGNWSGQAARTFSDVYTTFDGDFNKVILSLTDILEKLRAAGATYSQKEVDQVDVANRVKGLLNGTQH